MFAYIPNFKDVNCIISPEMIQQKLQALAGKTIKLQNKALLVFIASDSEDVNKLILCWSLQEAYHMGLSDRDVQVSDTTGDDSSTAAW
jgi:hypothetical protein